MSSGKTLQHTPTILVMGRIGPPTYFFGFLRSKEPTPANIWCGSDMRLIGGET